MKIRKGLLAIGLTLAVIAPLHASKITGLRAYVTPGAVMFSDAVGYRVMFGAQLSMKDLFGLMFDTSRMTDRLYTGLSFDISGAAAQTAKIFDYGFGLDFGYDLSLYMFGQRFSLAPQATIGMSFANVTETNTGISRKFGLMLLPTLSFDYVINPAIRAGLDVGYHMYFYDMPVMNLFAAVSFSYRFSFDNPRASSGTNDTEIHSVSFYFTAQYAPRFPAQFSQYDDSLKKAHTINEMIVKTRFDLDHFSANLAHMMNVNASEFPQSPTDALREFVRRLDARNIRLEIKTQRERGFDKYVVIIKEPSNPSGEIQEMINSFNKLIEDLPAFSEQGLSAINESSLVIQLCNTLQRTVSIDFVNENATYVSDANAQLKQTIDKMRGVPGQIEKLDKEVNALIQTIETVFSVNGGSR